MNTDLFASCKLTKSPINDPQKRKQICVRSVRARDHTRCCMPSLVRAKKGVCEPCDRPARAGACGRNQGYGYPYSCETVLQSCMTEEHIVKFYNAVATADEVTFESVRLLMTDSVFKVLLQILGVEKIEIVQDAIDTNNAQQVSPVIAKGVIDTRKAALLQIKNNDDGVEGLVDQFGSPKLKIGSSSNNGKCPEMIASASVTDVSEARYKVNYEALLKQVNTTAVTHEAELSQLQDTVAQQQEHIQRMQTRLNELDTGDEDDEAMDFEQEGEDKFDDE